MTNHQAEHINNLSNYLSEAIYETLTTHDTLEKYQKLIKRYAEKAELDYDNLKTDLEDFMELYNQVASDFVITEFQEKSLLAQGKIAYIKEETIQKLIHFVKTANKEEEKFTKHEVRMPVIDGKKEQGILLEYFKTDQDFIQKDDILCFVKIKEEKLPIKSPISGKVFHKKGLGEEVPYGGTICEVSDEKRTGKFEYAWQDGTKYHGDFLENEISGKGKFSYPNGDVYIGDVLEGKKNGSGKMTFENGDIYEGDWFADKMEGEGIFTIQSLDNFVLFESRKIHNGKATYKLPNGDTALAYFDDGTRHVGFNGTTVVINGTPKNDKLSQIKFSNGDTYYGEFENGVYHGKGFYHYAKANQPDFHGVKIKYYRANFVNGKAQGEYELNFTEALFDESDLITQAVDGKILAFEFPFLRHYEGDIENGEGKVYTSQYNLYYFIKARKRAIEDVEKEIRYLDEDKKDEMKKLQKRLETLKEELEYLYFDLEKERKEAKNKSEDELDNFNPLELDLLIFDLSDTKTNDDEDRKYYGVLEGNFKNFELQGIATYSNYYFSYEGEFKSLKLHGKGTLTMGNRCWIGQFENNCLMFGKYSEYGKLIYEGGFEDFYVADDFMNNPLPVHLGLYSGKGKLTQGEEYWEGEFSKGEFMQGKVKQKISMTMPFYSANLQEGILTGTMEKGLIKEGTFMLANGNTITGELLDGEFVNGKVKLEDSEYDGALKNGKAQGQGRFQNKDNYIYEGNFDKGMKNGFGKETRPDKSYYEGEWKENEQHGEGKWVKPNGEVYEGQFENGQKNGFGKFKMSSGDEYEGAFQANLFNGQGALQSQNGDRYEGQWKAGKRHGEGTQVLVNEDKTLTGLWEDDKLIKDYNKKNLWQKMFGKK